MHSTRATHVKTCADSTGDSDHLNMSRLQVTPSIFELDRSERWLYSDIMHIVQLGRGRSQLLIIQRHDVGDSAIMLVK